MELKDTLYILANENPNDMELGNKVRALVWQMKKAQSQEIAGEQLPGQLNIFDEDTRDDAVLGYD